MVRGVRRIASFAIVSAAIALRPAPAAAQTSLQIPLQFDFLNPGAKSLALGGAFAGLADDATATFANPAGLTQLDRSEVSIEARYTRVSTKFLRAGRLSGAVTNEGTDRIAGPVFESSIGSHFGPGYVSGVYVPRRAQPGRIWVVAAYRHELVRVDQMFLSEGVYQKAPEEFTSRRDSPQEGLRNVSITSYGVSGSYKPRADLSLGASLTFYSFHIDSTFRRFELLGGFFGPPDLTREIGRSTQIGDSISVAPTVGVLWTRGTTGIGVVYRQGASPGFETKSGNSPAKSSVFRVPHTFAVGASWRVRRLVTVAAEVTRVTYSRIREDFVTDQARETNTEPNFSIDDGTELHLGVQYSKPEMKFRPRFRAGLWYDPDHSIHFAPLSSTAVIDRLFNERLATALSTGKNQVHGTGGIGLTLGSHLDFNAGVDVASTTRLVSTSLIVK